MPNQINLAHQRKLQTISSAGYYLDDLGQSWQKMYAQAIDDSGRFSLGGEAASWEEHADESNLDHRIFSRLPAVAERLWSPKGATSSVDRIDKPRIGRTLCIFKQQLGLNVGPIFPDYCQLPSIARQASGDSRGFVGDESFDTSYADISGWQTLAIFSLVGWIATTIILCYRHFGVNREKRFVQNSYSPVSTEEEEEERIQSFDDEEM